MKKIKPLFKIPSSKWYIHNWIIENFPENYEKLDYLEPHFSDGSVFFNKNRSANEYVNDTDTGTVHILRCLRDETKHFIEKVKRTKYNENTFQKISKKNNLDHLNFAVSEFILRRMSRSGEKSTFIHSDASIDAWYDAIDDLPRIAERLLNCHIFNKPAFDVVHAFDEENVLIYLSTPDLVEKKLECTDAYINLANLLNNFKGKAIVSGKATAFYRRLFPNWKYTKKKVGTTTECLFMNY